MEIIKKEWSESELLERIVKEKGKQSYLKGQKKFSQEVDDKISFWEEKLAKVKK